MSYENPQDCPTCGAIPTWQRKEIVLPAARTPEGEPIAWVFDDVRAELQATLAKVDDEALTQNITAPARIELLAFAAYLFFKGRAKRLPAARTPEGETVMLLECGNCKHTVASHFLAPNTFCEVEGCACHKFVPVYRSLLAARPQGTAT